MASWDFPAIGNDTKILHVCFVQKLNSYIVGCFWVGYQQAAVRLWYVPKRRWRARYEHRYGDAVGKTELVTIISEKVLGDRSENQPALTHKLYTGACLCGVMGTVWFLLSCLTGQNIIRWRTGESEKTWHVHRPLFTTWTWVCPGKGKWAKLPSDGADEACGPVCQLLCSWGQTRQTGNSPISSQSPHWKPSHPKHGLEACAQFCF